MKNRIKKFFAGAFFAITLALSSCGGGAKQNGGTSGGNEGGSSGSQTTPVVIVETESDIKNQGLSEDVKQEIEKYSSNIDEEILDEIASVAVKYNVSNANLLKILQIVEKSNSIGRVSNSAEIMFDIIESTVSVLKQVKYSSFYATGAIVMNIISRSAYNVRPVETDPTIFDVSKSDMPYLEMVAEHSDNEEFKNTVEMYKGFFEEFKDKTVEENTYNPGDYLDDDDAEMSLIIDKYQVGIINLYEQIKTVFGKEKLIAFLELAYVGTDHVDRPSILINYFIDQSSYITNKTTISEINNNSFKWVDVISLSDIKLAISLLLCNSTNAQFLFELAREVLTSLSGNYKNPPVWLNVVLEILKNFNGSDLSALSQFIYKLLNLMTDEEFKSIMNNANSLTTLAMLAMNFINEKKYLIASAINSMTVEEVAAINKLSNYVGSDVLSFLSVVASNIVNIGGEDQDASNDALQTIVVAMQRMIGEIGAHFPSGNSSQGEQTSSDKQLIVNVNPYNLSYLEVNQQIDELVASLQINVFERDSNTNTAKSIYTGLLSDVPSQYKFSYSYEADLTEVSLIFFKFHLVFEGNVFNYKWAVTVLPNLPSESTLLYSNYLLRQVSNKSSSLYYSFAVYQNPYYGFVDIELNDGWNIVDFDALDPSGNKAYRVLMPVYYLDSSISNVDEYYAFYGTVVGGSLKLIDYRSVVTSDFEYYIVEQYLNELPDTPVDISKVDTSKPGTYVVDEGNSHAICYVFDLKDRSSQGSFYYEINLSNLMEQTDDQSTISFDSYTVNCKSFKSDYFYINDLEHDFSRYFYYTEENNFTITLQDLSITREGNVITTSFILDNTRYEIVNTRY